jgi:predicted transcriptional regulator
MLVKDILSNNLPLLHSSDTVFQSLQLMNENMVSHLPLVEHDEFKGMVSSEMLIDAEEEELQLGELNQLFPLLSVKADDHILKALQLASLHSLSAVAVLNENNEWVGALSYAELNKQVSNFLGLQELGGLIVLEKESNQFSISEITKLVETNDAQVTQLNTYTNLQTGLTQITVRISKPEISDIVATFQRYDYVVIFYSGEELYTNELKSNYDHLMHYLKI